MIEPCPGSERSRSGREKLKGGIVCCNRGEGLRGRSRRHNKISLHLAPKTIEIGFEYRKLLDVVQRAQAKSIQMASSFQRNLSGGFRVAHPLRTATRSNQVALTIEFQQIDGSCIEFARFASADLQQMDVVRTEAESDDETEGTIKEFFDWRGFAESGKGRAHGVIIATL